MKKLFTLVLPLLAMVMLTGCSDDDSKQAPSVVGTWLLTGYHDYTTETFTPVEDCYQETKIFNNDGTGSDLIIYCDDTQGTYPFLWEKAENNTYNFIVEGDIILPEIVNFENNNKMSITFGDDSAKIYERMLDE